jgi:hypothetical protein
MVGKTIVHKTRLIFYGIFFIAVINGLSSCVPVNKNTKLGAQKEGRLLNQKPTEIVSLNTTVGDDDEMVVRIKRQIIFITQHLKALIHCVSYWTFQM